MSHWNLKRAARLGYLAGRGLSVESIMADHVIAARSERAVRCAASRWGLALGIGSPFTIWHRILAPPPAACSSWPSSCWRCIRCRPASDNNPDATQIGMALVIALVFAVTPTGATVVDQQTHGFDVSRTA